MSFIVEFSVRKGLGPDFFKKEIPIYFDDVDAEIEYEEVKQWAIEEATRILQQPEKECPVFHFVAIHST